MHLDLLRFDASQVGSGSLPARFPQPQKIAVVELSTPAPQSDRSRTHMIATADRRSPWKPS